MSPSRTYSITCRAVEGALVSPCSIVLHAKVPKGVLMVLSVSSAGATRIWKYLSQMVTKQGTLAHD